jgi:uncharacterized protein
MTFEMGGETLGIVSAVLIAAIFFLAGVVKGAAAFGIPLVTMPLLAQLVPVPTAAALVVISILVSNIVQVVQMRHAAGVLRLLWPLYLVLPLTLVVSARLIKVLDPAVLFLLVGVMIELFVALQITRRLPPIPPKLCTPLLSASGLIAGIVGGATSFFAFPSIQIFLALGLAPAEFVFATSAMFVVGSIALGAGYATVGLLPQTELVVSALAVLPLLVGQQLGQRLSQHGSATRFRRVVMALMVFMGISMIARGLAL